MIFTLRRNRRTTVRVQSRLIRTAISLFAAAAFGLPAVAQAPNSGNSYVPPPIVSPWPGSRLRPIPATQLPPAQSPWVQTRTIYYRKETNRPGVRPAAAVEVAQPRAADQPMKPMEPPPKMTDPLVLDPRKPGSDGVPPLFRLEGEQDLMARENAERLKKKLPLEPIVFPVHAPTSSTPFMARALSPMQAVMEPNYVCYGRLLFEDKNSERYGWNMGPLQPMTDVLTFLSNASNLPYNFFAFPGLWYDSSAGLCLPGDPVPYYLYPPGFSVSGFVGQALVTVALYAIFP